MSREMTRCYELLNMTSRSFAAVIQALDDELRPAVCIFYLVLRGLDTIGVCAPMCIYVCIGGVGVWVSCTGLCVGI